MKKKKSLFVLIALVVCCIACLIGANSIQHDSGNVEIETGVISVEKGDIAYKLYKPSDVSSVNKAPAALLLHGYQNDHETCAAYAMELSRRGYVVLSIDEYGHGATNIGLLNRGYVNHKVTTNYGLDSKEDGTYADISGANRYKLMMNFSNLSFFDDYYSKDDQGNSVSDSSCGGIDAYKWLSELDYVDNKNMVISGHSMGTWSSWTVAAAYANSDIKPRATVLQCGELFSSEAYDENKYSFDNVMLLQAKYDEFSYFRDYKNIVSDELLDTDLRKEFLNEDNCEWNTTYGDFEDGSARRIELLYTNHRLTTHNEKGLATAIEWFDNATNHVSSIASTDIKANVKETLTLIATLAGIFAALPLFDLILDIPFFSDIKQDLPSEKKVKSKGKWFKGALISIFLAGASFPFMSQLGHGLLPLPEGIFRMTIGNGFISWYSLLIIIMIVTTIMAIKSKKNPSNYYEMGLSSVNKENSIDWKLFFKSLLAALLSLTLVYVLVIIAEKVFCLDLRYIWPMFKTFSSERALQFLVYIPIFMLFYILNNSKIMAGLRTKATYEPGIKGFLKNYLVNCFVMVGGVLIITLIEYIPFFLDLGPGADLLFGSTFGGPFMSLLILFMPQILVFAVFCTFGYRKTGCVYPGAIMVAMLACWIVTGGSSML